MHVLTSAGAGLALLALLAAARADWQAMFLWLGVALIVDAIDSPLARRIKVQTILPRWSGERLDLIIDYLTYVAVSAFALCRSELLPVSLAVVGIFIALTFAPVLWVHPFRVRCLRPLTVLVTATWGGAAILAIAEPFPSPLWIQFLLIATAAYLIGIGTIRSLAAMGNG